MTKDNELVVLPEIKYEITTESATALATEFAIVPEFDPSLGKKDETNALIITTSKRMNKEVAQVEKLRKQFKEPALVFGRAVDEKAKELKGILEPAKLSWGTARGQIDKYEAEQEQKRIEAEKLRVDTIETKIRELQAIPGNAIGGTSEEIKAILESMELPKEEEYEEKTDIAVFLYTEAIEKLEGMVEQAIKAEQADVIAKEAEAKAKEAADKAAEEQRAERAALDKERAEFEAEKRAATEAARMKKAEEEAAQLEKDQAAEAKEKALREKADAAAQALADEANKAIEDEAFKKLEAETLEHIRATIDTAADEEGDPAQYLLSAIIMEEIPNVRWTV